MKKTETERAFILSLAGAGLAVLIIALLDPLLNLVPHLPDKGAAWYFWQLPARTVMGRLSAWLGYALHQASLWTVVVLMMKEKPHPGRLSRLNVAALAVNGAFILMHILQTHLWYDGLAQDVPVWSSQFSVIIMLVLILYLESPRRGLFAGRKIRWNPDAFAAVGRWHGLYISWALVYTFWFHPTEGDFGLLTGFFYMFLLLIQASFANTEIHFRKGWIVVLELLVGLHGPAIAIQKALEGGGEAGAGSGIWIMFATGFLFIIVFTSQFAFSWSPKIRGLVFAAYAALVFILYSWRGFGRIYEVSFIPVALYGGALALAAVGGGLARIFGSKGFNRGQKA